MSKLPEGYSYLYQVKRDTLVELPDGKIVKGGYLDGIQYIVYDGTHPIVASALLVVKLVANNNNKTEKKKNALPIVQHPVVKPRAKKKI